MINGLAIKTINSKIINGFKIRLNVLSNNVMPKETKNITEKKSLSGFILPMISILYGKLANEIPATKAPITIENPKKLNIIE